MEINCGGIIIFREEGMDFIGSDSFYSVKMGFGPRKDAQHNFELLAGDMNPFVSG